MKHVYNTLKVSVFITLIGMSTQLYGQQYATVQGEITTSDGKPAEAVTVLITELKKGSTSNAEGLFNIRNIKPGTYHLKAQAIGLESQEKTVSLRAGELEIVNFRLAESAEQLSEITVTGYQSVNQRPVSAGKMAIKPLDNPQMVTVIGSAVIADQQVNRLSDVVRNVNGLALGATRGSTQETFYARGYNLNSTNIFKNGARVSSGAIPEASTLESVEVLRGSAALLYGNVSGGAVVNMVTKQPKFNYGGEVSLRSGSYNFFKPTADFYGPISKDLAFRIIGTVENAESYRKNVSTERYYVNPSFLYTISNKTDLLVQGDYLRYNNTPDFGIGSLGSNQIPTGIARSAFFNTPWAYNKAAQGSVSASLNHEFSSTWKLNSTVAYQEYRRNYFSTERIQADAEGKWMRNLNRAKTSEAFSSAQVNLTGSANTGRLKHSFLVGTDAEEFLTASNAFSYGPGAFVKGTAYDSLNILQPGLYPTRIDEPSTTALTRTSTPTYRFGYYVQDLIEVSEKLKVLAGIRWSFQKTAAAKRFTYATGERQTIAASKIDRAWSPRFGLVYQPVSSTSLFVSYANNFIVNSGMNVDSLNLRPSVVDQYEAGIKNDLLDGRLSLNASVYRITNDNTYAQAAFLKNGNPNTDRNIKEAAGETISEGVELDINGTILPGLNMMAGYSYNFIRYTNTSGEKFSYIEGERLVGSTAHTGNISLFYTLNSGRIKGLKLGASAFYTGKRNGGWNNQYGEDGQPLYSYNRLIPVSGFTTVDLSAGYSFRKFSLLAKLSNLTNELNYYVHENYSINPIAPRQLITTLSYKF